jgi:hypothetical protein
VTGTIPFDARLDDLGPIWMVEIRGGEFRYFPTLLEER